MSYPLQNLPQKEETQEEKIKRSKKVAAEIRKEKEDYYKNVREKKKAEIKNLKEEINLLNSKKPKKEDFLSLAEYEKALGNFEKSLNELEAKKKKAEKELAESREEISALRDMKRSKLTKKVNGFLGFLNNFNET